MQKKMKGMALTLMLVVAPALAAQHKMPADTGRAGMMQRMEDHVRKELGLTDDQAAKLHATHERFHPQHREIMERGRAIHEALRGQLQPGVAANSDSVRKLLDARLQNRAALMQLERDADRELAGYLTPVQRARFEMMMAHMMARGRMHGPGGMRGMPGMRGMGGMEGHEGDHHGGHMRPGGGGGGGAGDADEDESGGDDGDE